MPDICPPLLQSSIDVRKTTTLNEFQIKENTHIPGPDIPPPVDHRSLENHYTE